MDILNLLTRMENLDDLCIICGFPNEKHTEENYRGGPCPLKSAIDALRSGRLLVVEKNTIRESFIDGLKVGRPLEKFMGTAGEHQEWFVMEWIKKEQGNERE